MNKFLRLVLVLLSFLIFGIGSTIISLVIFPLISLINPKKDIYIDVIHKSWKFFVKVLKFLKIIKLNTNICNPNIVSGKIIVASHPSLIDIIILIGLFPKSTCIAKNDVVKNPFIKNIVKNAYIINSLDIENLNRISSQYLKNGFNIIIFPTGTRTRKTEEIKIHKGAADISISTGCEILPVKIETSFDFLCKNMPIYHVGSTTVQYYIKTQPIIDPNQYSNLKKTIARKRICDKIKDFIK